MKTKQTIPGPHQAVPQRTPATQNLSSGDGASALADVAVDANDELGFYHVQANLNCAAMANVVVWALNEVQAKRKAQQLFDSTRFHVVGNTRRDSKVYTSLLQENVDIEICQIDPQDDEVPPVEEDAIRHRIEAELGRLLLQEMESLEGMEKSPAANHHNISKGLEQAVRHRLFESLWALYQELHEGTEGGGDRVDPGLSR